MAIGEGGQAIDAAVQIVASGAAITAGAMGVASSSLAVATYKTRNFRTLIFNGAMSVAPTAGETIDIYERALAISGASNANATTTAYKHRYVGSFKLDSAGTSQILESNAIPVKPYDVEYYLFANSSANINSTWTLDALHWSYNVSQA